jgi:PAS domain S-box-containing protein
MKKLNVFNFRISERSPRFLFLFLVFLILFLELAIMVGFEILDYNNHLIVALIDAAILIISITPFLYFFLYRPNLYYIQEIKTMVQTMEESEQKYREIAENSPDAIIIHVDGKIVYINNESLLLMGLTSPSDLIGKSVLQFVHPEFREMIIERMKIAAIEGTHLPLTEEKFIRPDGSVLDVEVKTMAISYENRPAVQLIIRDITWRKRAKEEQQVIYDITSSVATTNNLNELLKLIHQSLGKVLYADNIFVALFDQNTKLFSFPYWVDQFDSIPEPDAMRKSLSFYVFRTGKPFLFTPESFELLKVQNEVESVGSYSPSWVGVPLVTPAGTIGVLVLQNYEKEKVYSEQDVQFLDSVGSQAALAIDRKRAEEKLHNERLLLRTVIDNIPDSIYCKDISYRKTLANPTELSYSGAKSESEIIGKTDFDLYPNELAEGFYADDQLVLQKGGSVLNREEYVLDSAGQRHWLLTSKLPMKDELGNITGLVGIGRDITGRRQAEEDLRESEIKLNVILQSTADGILAIDGNGKVIKANKRFAELWRIPQPLIDSGDDEALIAVVLDQLTNPEEFIAKVQKLYHTTVEDLDYLHFKDGRTFERFSAPMVMNDSSIGRVWSFRDITEQKQAEDELKKSEALYRSLVNRMPDGVYKSTHDGKFIEINPAMVKMLGYDSKEELMAIDIKSQLYFEATDRESLILQEQMEEMGVYRLKKKDGSAVWVEDHGWYNIGVSGEIITHEGIMRDITERKRIEDLLQLSEERYRTLIDNIGEGIGFVNSAEQFEFANSAAEKIFGVGPGELIGLKLDQLLPMDQYYLIQKETEKRTKGENSIYEFEIIRSDGEKRTILITAVAKTDQNGQFMGTYGVFSDITERKQAEEAQQKLNLAMNNSQEVVFMTDTEGIISYINPQFTKTYGYTAEDVVGKVTPRILNSGMYKIEDSKKIWDALLNKQSIPKTEYQNKCKDGKLIEVEGSANPILDNNGNIVGFLGIQRDITMRKQTEKVIKETNQQLAMSNSEKDKFFSIIAHDLRSPFNGFLGLTRIMAEGLPGYDESQKMAIQLQKSATKLFRLLENLLHWSQMQQGVFPFNPSAIRLLPVVNEIISLAEESANLKNISISNDIPGDLDVFADNAMLQTVIRNLLSNAVKFTPRGGKISISAKVEKEELVAISVTDSGIGMDANMVNNLFSLNAQTNREGTEKESSSGLGLLLCKEFVEKQGGKLWVESEVGKGSTFCFTIPFSREISDKNENEKTFRAETKGNTIENLKILIAEDDETSDFLITIAVKPLSKEILKAKTGMEAVEACSKNPDIDLVLMDIKMPDINGYEATRQIRKFNKNIVIIAQTAFGLSSDREKAIAAGCNDYIAKPINKDELIAIIEKQINKKADFNLQ